MPIDPPRTILNYLVLIGGEVLIGLTLGVGVLILFSGVQLAGQVIAQMSGLSLADVFNPGFDTSVPLISQFLYMFALAIYVISGGHRILMAGLLGTFSSIPPGAAGLSTSIVDAMSVLVTESFTLGVRAAAPATVALLLATLVMGLISRTLPQLNILAVGFGLNAMVTFGVDRRVAGWPGMDVSGADRACGRVAPGSLSGERLAARPSTVRFRSRVR